MKMLQQRVNAVRYPVICEDNRMAANPPLRLRYDSGIVHSVKILDPPRGGGFPNDKKLISIIVSCFFSDSRDLR